MDYGVTGICVFNMKIVSSFKWQEYSCLKRICVYFRANFWRVGLGFGRDVSALAGDLPVSADRDERILDTREQEALVEDFERKHKNQNALWRGTFAAFAATCAVFFLYSAQQQAGYPWQTRHHAAFSATLNSRLVVYGDLAEAVTCIAIAVGVFSSAKWHRHLLVASTMSGLLLSLFWIFNLPRSQKFHHQILWLPIGTPSLAAICLYVDNVLAETAKDIQALRASMYHFKRS